MSAIPTQIKKDQSDPDFDQIDERIIHLSRTNGFLRGPFTLFLVGQLTWREALELMIIVLTKEHKDLTKVFTEVVTEKQLSLTSIQPITLLLNEIKRKNKKKRTSRKKTRKKREPKWYPEI